MSVSSGGREKWAPGLVRGLPVRARAWQRLRVTAVEAAVFPLLWWLDFHALLGFGRVAVPEGYGPALLLLSVVLYLSMFWRRRRPLAVLTGTVAGGALCTLLVPGLLAGWCVWVGLFTAASRCTPARAAVGLAIALGMVGPVLIETVRLTPDPSERPAEVVIEALWLVLLHGLAFAAGRWVRWNVAQRTVEAREAAARAEAEERRRIARELHDVVAHAVSLMVLQAGGAEHVLDSDPDRARAALRHVGELGEQATVELHRMLDLLDSERTAADGDIPGLQEPDGVGRLVEQVRSAGRTVELTVAGRSGALDPATDRAACRILQEALTNAVKHADPRAPVEVAVIWDAGAVRLSVRTRGRRTPSPAQQPSAAGRGIPGMVERARAVDGTVSAGPTSDGGFRVSACLPLPPLLLPARDDSASLPSTRAG
ncbi:MAG: sensor histidine kinase [Actinomycetota bacterium]